MCTERVIDSFPASVLHMGDGILAVDRFSLVCRLQQRKQEMLIESEFTILQYIYDRVRGRVLTIAEK